MKKKKLLIIVSTICLALILVALPLVAACEEEEAPPAEEEEEAPPAEEEEEEEEETFVIRVSLTGSEDSLEYRTAAAVAENVEERSNGRLQFEMYPLSELVEAPANFDAVKTGTIEMYIGSMVYFEKTVTVLQGLTLPLYESREHTYAAWKAGQRDLMQAALEEHNIKILGTNFWCPTGIGGAIFTKFPVHVPADLEGYLIRAPGVADQAVVTNAGGTVASMPAAEQYLALQQGTIDGTITIYELAKDRSLHEVVDYICRFRNGFGSSFFPMNLDFFNSLPSDLQQIIEEEFGDKCWDIATEIVEEAYAAVNELYEDTGLIIYDPTSAELESWWALSESVVNDWVTSMGEVGEEWIDCVENTRS